MISEKLIKDRISESIRDGANQYAIYPFGLNGANVKRILNDYFDISLDYIIEKMSLNNINNYWYQNH